MITKRVKPQFLTIAASAVLLIILVTALDTHKTAAFNPQPDPPAFGMIAITPDQTARLNVVRTEPPGNPDRPMTVELTFFDSDGMSLLRSTATVRAGRAVFLDLAGFTVPRTGMRTEIRGSVHIVTSLPEPDRNRVNLVANIEIFDTETGKTMVVLPAIP
jgi:hypothetical protein